MTAEVTLTVLGRLGGAVRLARIDIRGRTARHVSAEGQRSLPTTAVIDEVLALLPPTPGSPTYDIAPVRAAWEAIAAFARAADGVAASYAKSMLGWDAVPECVLSLQDSVGAEFLVTTQTSGSEVLRWWVSGDAGWVGVALASGEVCLVPSSAADIRFSLLTDLVGAMTARPT